MDGCEKNRKKLQKIGEMGIASWLEYRILPPPGRIGLNRLEVSAKGRPADGARSIAPQFHTNWSGAMLRAPMFAALHIPVSFGFPVLNGAPSPRLTVIHFD
jgi:hypothetical protein